MQNLYLERPNLYIGFHGCEKKNGLNLVNIPKQVNLSTANHEWLGEGFKSFEEAEDPIRYDSVRGAFYEGDVAYKGTEIRKKNHIQVCLRNMNCIKGFFLPRS